MTEWINCGERDCSAAMRRTASSIPEGGATGNGPGEASTTCGGTTAPATLTSVTDFGLTTTLLTNFPVRRSGRTTLVIRSEQRSLPDWSSDVCSSDLTCGGTTAPATLTSVTDFGLTTTLLTNFPVRRSGRTTLVI